MVPVRKNNGEIRLCVFLRNLNRTSLKDNYPFPKIDQMIQKMVGYKRIFMVYGFSEYNKVRMDP
jgi:hypothetical protein